jgi:HD-GYP domain-containing protein (c-di-GMP phosphodiesterase class II)
LHDIGKIGIPDSILLKKGPLNDQEWETMKTHALIGENVLSSSRSTGIDAFDVISIAINIAGGHHERWDGSGYPRQLVGEAIPLEARIMALADVYDALTTERPYKKPWSHEDAYQYILSNQGTQFQPQIVNAFIAEEESFKTVAQEFND